MKKYRIKTMKEILEEFPEAYFDDYGNLCCEKWEDLMLREMFQYLGTQRDLEFEIYKWIPEWYEVIEETQEVVWTPFYAATFLRKENKKLISTEEVNGMIAETYSGGDPFVILPVDKETNKVRWDLVNKESL